MGYSQAAWLLKARSEVVGGTDAPDGVRDATQADIRKFMCG